MQLNTCHLHILSPRLLVLLFSACIFTFLLLRKSCGSSIKKRDNRKPINQIRWQKRGLVKILIVVRVTARLCYNKELIISVYSHDIFARNGNYLILVHIKFNKLKLTRLLVAPAACCLLLAALLLLQGHAFFSGINFLRVKNRLFFYFVFSQSIFALDVHINTTLPVTDLSLNFILI
jgi:hypothetical protein